MHAIAVVFNFVERLVALRRGVDQLSQLRALVGALRRSEEAAAELAAIPDTSHLKAADETRQRG